MFTYFPFPQLYTVHVKQVEFVKWQREHWPTKIGANVDSNQWEWGLA